MKIKDQIADMYLVYLRDFLSVQQFADYYDLPLDYAQTIIRLGRMFHNERTGN